MKPQTSSHSSIAADFSLSVGPQRTVAIVGRPNVGKSALFNRLVGKPIAIVHDQPGITRDRLAAEVHKGTDGLPFELIDTGGIGADVDTDFTTQVRAEAEIAIATASVLLFVVDGRAGVTPVDQELARFLRQAAKHSKPVLLVVNKIDQPRLHAALAADFDRLGFSETILVSAAHGVGIGDLVEAIENHLPKASPLIPAQGERGQEGGGSTAKEGQKDQKQLAPRLAIVGRPNVGKSSLTNALLGQQRTLVSDLAGTTRDAIDVPCELRGKPYILIDTAGLRHRRKHDSTVEVFSAMRSEKSIERADLCVLVIDASQGVTSQDRQIAGLIQEAKKPCVIVINKWDLMLERFAQEQGWNLNEAIACDDVVEEDQAEEEADPSSKFNRFANHPEVRQFRQDWIDSARAELFFINYAPVVVLSAREGKNLGRLSTAIESVRRAANHHVGTGVLNRALHAALAKQPPPIRNGKRFKLLYVTQLAAAAAAADPTELQELSEEEEETSKPKKRQGRGHRSHRSPRGKSMFKAIIPPPAFLCFVNDPALLPESYRQYLENQIRAEVNPYPGLPILLKWRARDREREKR